VKWCWHKWRLVPEPSGWSLSELGGMYRRCQKCGRYEARLPKGYNADFWQEIEVAKR
jgi:hypothetical protein